MTEITAAGPTTATAARSRAADLANESEPPIAELVAELAHLKAEVAVLSRHLDATESVLQIQQLKARYGELVDQRFTRGSVVDDDSLKRIANQAASLFTEDGVWDGGPGLGMATGRDEIAARLSEPTLSFSRHLFLKPRIDVNGDRASARWDLLCPCSRADGSSYWMCGFEDDEYIRVDGIWLHMTMKLTTVFMSPVGDGWDRILA